MSNVKLAIRVRPFTDRELSNDKERVPVVSVVDEKTVAITNVKVSLSGAGDSRERVRRYFADYTFDSACAPEDPSYASQEKVFESLGREVGSCMSRGQSACVLAYGQSATGKTHTMMGSDAQPGLVPRLCRALGAGQLDITVSFLEIYNERVHDLLAGEAPVTCYSLPRRRGNALKDLRVREHPSRGPYVQNLRRVAVHDVETLLSLVGEGARRRHTAATRRNTTSSRSHALLELATPTTTLHLADLAGSEKASWDFCGGNGRQKEGANINKSLVALSNVISALVSGGQRGRFVPYRDSALTWLLKDCFTGGAKTFIIATVSPSVACYGESASTLRWAARARQLPSTRAPCTGPSAASRAALQAQLSQLIAELARHHIRYIPETGKIFYGEEHWLLKINTIETPSKSTSEQGEHKIKIHKVMNYFSPKSETSESNASSVASGSSEAIKGNTREQLNNKVDKVFGPVLERTKSGTDIKTTALSKQKKRQYKSQEILPVGKSLQIHDPETSKKSPSQSYEKLNKTGSSETKASVPILYDNQRAEIVASVTERLYTKLKKKEETAVNKMESVVDKKIVEPLSELKICTNARQRLVELSQKALRHRRRIGIPAHTQTRITATRVRDQGNDVQTDLDMYVTKRSPSMTLQRDVATETIPMTPRCKEIAVGPVGSLDFRDCSTLTETEQVGHRNTFMMTDVIEKYNRSSQTPPVVPPRKKKRAVNVSKYIHNDENTTEEYLAPPVISINISQHYPADSDTQSSDDNQSDRTINDKHTSATMTPDLLTNHSTGDAIAVEDVELNSESKEEIDAERDTGLTVKQDELVNKTTPEIRVEDFPDSDEHLLPRVTIVSTKTATEEDLKDIIFGRNNSIYPYNIALSPLKDHDGSKRTVKFKDCEVSSLVTAEVPRFNRKKKCPLNICESENSDMAISDTEFRKRRSSIDSPGTFTDSDSSKLESESSFVWKKVDRAAGQIPKTSVYSTKSYTPVYNKTYSNANYKTAKAKIYREFLGLENNEPNKHLSDSTESEQSQHSFKERRLFFENKFKYDDSPRKRIHNYSSVELNLLDSCNSLDATVNKYESYLAGCHNSGIKNIEAIGLLRTPSEYLQHLVQLRRDLVKESECDVTDSAGQSCM